MVATLGSVTVFSEDGGKDAHATVQTLVPKMLGLIEPGCPTNRIAFLPRDEQEQCAVTANRWKSTRGADYADITLLVRTIATRIAVEGGFVLFHFDGDRRWSARARSENLGKWKSIIVTRVRRALESNRTTADRAEACLQKLIPVVPFYSIEAWLYQNTDVARRLCRIHHRGAGEAELAAWQADRTLLDEVVKPKDVFVLGSQHNLELAGAGFPVAAVYEAKKSFYQVVVQMEACESLRELLRGALSSAAPSSRTTRPRRRRSAQRSSKSPRTGARSKKR